MFGIMVIIISIWATVTVLFISSLCLVKKSEMKSYKNLFISKINNCQGGILERKVSLSKRSFRLMDIKKNNSLLDYLTWEDIENIDLSKLFKEREHSPEKIFLRKIHNLPEEALQRKVLLSQKIYSLKQIKEDWRRLFKSLDINDWLRIWGNPGLTQVRINPR
jgi:hypothetical protein